MTETELRDAYGMGRHEFRQYEDGEGCSCGREFGHQRTARNEARQERVRSVVADPDRHVDKSGECWVWTGERNRGGYGRSGGVLVHRAAWVRANGPIPEGMFVLHHCDNPPCVRPDHLWLGTLADNNRDRDEKGRRPPPTHCSNGHPFTAESTRIHPGRPNRPERPYRYCVICSRERGRRAYAEGRRRRWVAAHDKPHQHTPHDPEPGCEFCEVAAK